MVKADVGQDDRLGPCRRGRVVACTEPRFQNGPGEPCFTEHRERPRSEKFELRCGYLVGISDPYGFPHRGGELLLRDEATTEHNPLGIGEDVRRKVRPGGTIRRF